MKASELVKHLFSLGDREVFVAIFFRNSAGSECVDIENLCLNGNAIQINVASPHVCKTKKKQK